MIVTNRVTRRGDLSPKRRQNELAGDGRPFISDKKGDFLP
jgi:hypothetical protein